MARLCKSSIKSAPVLDKQVAVQSVSRTTDGAGGVTDTWATDFTTWMSINPASANEKFRAMQMETEITHKLIMRYRSGVTTAQRLLYGSRVFNIIEVLNINEANSYLEIKAVEGAAT